MGAQPHANIAQDSSSSFGHFPGYIFGPTGTPRTSTVEAQHPGYMVGSTGTPRPSTVELQPPMTTYSPFVPNFSPAQPSQGGTFAIHPGAVMPPAPGHPPNLATHTHYMSPGLIPPQPTLSTPLRLGPSESAFQSTVCHHLDRMANPDTGVTSKPGAFESAKRIDEIWVYCARGFYALPVHLCPDIVGKQLALQLKSLNTQLWRIYETAAIPTAFTNKLCLAAATFRWGGRSNDAPHAVGEQDFATYTPSELDRYRAPSGWALDANKPHSLTLETWRRNATNQPLVFSLIYGNIPGTDLLHLQPRREAIGRLYQLHLRNPNKYTLKFTIETWGELNSWRVETLRETSNHLRLLRKVERSTFEELEETGTSLDPTGRNIFSLPDTFNLQDPSGYFQHQLLGALERDYDRVRWDQYYKTPPLVPNRNAGPEAITLGPAQTTRGRRICALNSPKTTKGSIIFWDFNTQWVRRG